MAVWGSNWGATAAEMTRAYPCDGMMRVPDQRWFRAVDIAAPRPLVFAWLCQMRAAPYSYDWLDNLGRRSPQTRDPKWTELAVGQSFMTIFELASFERDRHATIVSKGGRQPKWFAKLAISYLIEAREPGHSRLLVKIEIVYPRNPLGWLQSLLLPLGEWIMMRRQLLNFKRLAERDWQTKK